MKMSAPYRYWKYCAKILLLYGSLLLLAVGCGAPSPTATPSPTPTAPIEESQIITVGDIELDEPTKKIKRFQPLADYLAEHLKEFGIKEGRVVIARDISEMARFLKDGTVDIYSDSPFPTLAVQELSGSKVILRRWKGNTPTYWSTYVALRDSGIAGVDDFVGKIVAFEEPNSTSGFALPAATLIQRGFSLRQVDESTSQVSHNEIGYIFSGDEENTFELLLQGRVAGGGISNQDYEKLPQELKERLITFDRTITVPRQLVSVRPGLDSKLVNKVSELLVDLENTEEGQKLLEHLKKTKKFDPALPGTDTALQELFGLIKSVSKK